MCSLIHPKSEGYQQYWAPFQKVRVACSLAPGSDAHEFEALFVNVEIGYAISFLWP